MSENLTKARAAKIARAGMYATSIVALTDANGIDFEVYSGGGRAHPGERSISIAPVTGVVSYYVALHEIGHIVCRGRSAPKLEQEANAWQWAIDNAIVEPSPAVRKGIARRLRSYHSRHVRQARTAYRRFPPAEHVFWKLADLKPPRDNYDGRAIKL